MHHVSGAQNTDLSILHPTHLRSVAWGDAGTVRAHLEALGALRDPGAGGPLGDVVEGYRAMSAATVERRAATGRLDPARAAALRDALGGGEP